MLNRFLGSLFILLYGCIQTVAQTGVSSPYSRYGLGNLQESGFHSIAGMGGIGIALYNPEIINLSNPASYTSFKPQSFILETGVETNTVKLTSSDTNQTTYSTSISYFAFGFPITKWWGSSIGIKPFTKINYSVSDSVLDSNIGKVKNTYQGSGGVNQLYWGNGFRIGNFSFGINASYLFGPLEKSSREIFEAENTLHYYTDESINIGAFYFNYGIQYKYTFDTLFHHHLKDKITITAGAVAELNTNLKARRRLLAVTFEEYVSDPFLILPKDTIVYSTDTGTIVFPGGLGVGFSVNKGDKWLVEFDYSRRNWSDFTAFKTKDSLVDFSKMNFGVQYTPDPNSTTKYFKTVQYRIGAHLENTYLQIKGTPLAKSGISFGLGLPIKQIKSTFNLVFEVGEMGTTDNNLIKENYWKAGIGITLSDIWFVKRKYD